MTTPLVPWLPQKSVFQKVRTARGAAWQRRLRAWRWLFSAVLVIGTTGCAGAYHDYPSGCVPYAYCPAPPLPYHDYHGCPTPIAKGYLADSRRSKASEDRPEESGDAGQRGS